jgi:Rps23 Pro-64 3,4-dihydroxylase Tpa1-like proline 4-hydroxylase
MQGLIDRLPRSPDELDALGPDRVTIRGVDLPLDGLVDATRLAPGAAAALHHAFIAADPFPHLVIDGLFDATLLDLLAEEFDLLDASRWRRSYDGQHERTLRSMTSSRLGHAADQYFHAVHSGAFVDFLQHVSGVPALITDPHLVGGGFHESRHGGRFRVHTDFNKHEVTQLDSELVLITYLNRDWDAAWGGALELWRAKPRECVKRIEPVFGRSVLMRRTPLSFHGHPVPLDLPPGRVRRSVAAYYYSHRSGGEVRAHPTEFMDHTALRLLRIAARQVTPPLLWNGIKRLLGR